MQDNKPLPIVELDGGARLTLLGPMKAELRRLARLDDVEATVPGALSRGSFFFADIQHNQVDAAGLALLRFVAAQEERAAVSREALIRRFPDELERVLAFLCQCELIEPADGGYRLQVELIRRWFTQK